LENPLSTKGLPAVLRDVIGGEKWAAKLVHPKWDAAVEKCNPRKV